ncbi:hypothetical protein Tco_0566008 [Tanacetum coccineum]
MLKRCEDTNLSLNWEKSHFMVKEGIVLGHKISKSGIEVDRAKVEVWICQISQEISQKRTRERMSDQEAKDLKAEAREIMPQPSTVNCKKPQSKPKLISIAY